jgi:hypothetical protein
VERQSILLKVLLQVLQVYIEVRCKIFVTKHGELALSSRSSAV